MRTQVRWLPAMLVVACGGRTLLDDGSASVDPSTTGGVTAYQASMGGMAAGGISGGGNVATGGVRSGGAPSTGGAITGGASSSSVRHTGGTPSSGGARTGGSHAAGATSLGTDATGGFVASGGFATGGVSSPADVHVDAAGDATDPSGDLLEAHVYVDASTLQVQLRFTALPVPATLDVTVNIVTQAGKFALVVSRWAGALHVESHAGNASLSYEACSVLAVNPATGWLTVTLPLLVLPDQSLSSFTVASQYAFNKFDQMAAGSIAPEPGPGPDRDATPSCDRWDSVRSSTVRFSDVSLGFDFGCGLDLTGRAVCWGTSDAMGWVGAAPSDTFTQIAVSNQWRMRRVFACGLRSDGKVVCWGDKPPLMSSGFTRIGEPVACGVYPDGNTKCINDTLGQTFGMVPQTGTSYIDVVGFADQTCSLSNNGTIQCWPGITEPLGNDFTAVELATETDACGLRRDGTLVCGEGVVPPLVLRQFDSPFPSGNMHFGCGVQPNGAPICWGAAGIVVPVAPGPFKRIEVSTAGEGVCGFKNDDTLDCWDYIYIGGNALPATTPP